jgi:DNA-binding response OmpR family regulator
MIPSQPLNILLVEDNPGDARLVEEMLRESTSYQAAISKTATVAAAHDIIRAMRFDVILLDLSLPDGDGLATVAIVGESAPLVPLIVLTGRDDDEIALGSIRSHAQDYLIKGQIDARLLSRSIRYAIERKQVEIEKDRLLAEVQELFGQVKSLRGLLPMCSWCKKIRDDNGEWHSLEHYVQQHSNASITHSVCPACAGQVKQQGPRKS